MPFFRQVRLYPGAFDRLLFAADQPVLAAAPLPPATRMAFGLPQAIGRALPLERSHGFELRCTTAGAAGPRRTLPFCCNGRVFLQ